MIEYLASNEVLRRHLLEGMVAGLTAVQHCEVMKFMQKPEVVVR